MKILIERIHDSGVQTIGRFYLLRSDNSVIYRQYSVRIVLIIIILSTVVL